MNNNINIKKGQILVIVLLVMMVLAIVIVTVTNNIIRDIQQSQQNVQYETLYSEAEKHVLNLSQSLVSNNEVRTATELTTEVVESLNGTGFNVSTSDCAEDTSLANRTAIICKINDTTNREFDDAEIRIQVIDSPFLEEVVLAKDEIVAFKIDPTNPGSVMNQTFTVTMAGEGMNSGLGVALEVALDFKYTDNNSQTQYSTVRATYDKSPFQFPNTAPDNLNDSIFLFSTGTQNTANSFTFTYDVNFVNRILASHMNSYINDSNTAIIPLQFRFKPIIRSSASGGGIPVIELSVTTTSPLPLVQSRIFRATAYEVKDGQIFGAQSFVQASVPGAKIPSIFDYVLRTQSDITHQTP